MPYRRHFCYEDGFKVGPGGTHTQGVKFVTKRHELGVFRHTLLLNFSNFIYEHGLVVNVSTPKATEDLELLKPQSEFVRPTLPEEDEDGNPICAPTRAALITGRAPARSSPS